MIYSSNTAEQDLKPVWCRVNGGLFRPKRLVCLRPVSSYTTHELLCQTSLVSQYNQQSNLRRALLWRIVEFMTVQTPRFLSLAQAMQVAHFGLSLWEEASKGNETVTEVK